MATAMQRPHRPRRAARVHRSIARCCWSCRRRCSCCCSSFTRSSTGWCCRSIRRRADALANYRKFFTTDNLWPTIWTTLKLALPATLINVGLALPIAFKMRVKSRYQRWITTMLVVPITLGTVLIAEGMLTYFGPKGWLSQFLQFCTSVRQARSA